MEINVLIKDTSGKRFSDIFWADKAKAESEPDGLRKMLEEIVEEEYGEGYTLAWP